MDPEALVFAVCVTITIFSTVFSIFLFNKDCDCTKQKVEYKIEHINELLKTWEGVNKNIIHGLQEMKCTRPVITAGMSVRHMEREDSRYSLCMKYAKDL